MPDEGNGQADRATALSPVTELLHYIIISRRSVLGAQIRRESQTGNGERTILISMDPWESRDI